MPKKRRRSQLLRVAQEVFVIQGYHAASMDDIADRAGVSKPVLYQHFPGKLELYLALLDEGTEELTKRLHAALRSTTDNKARVEAAVHTYVEFVDDKSGIYRLLFESDVPNVPEVRQRLEHLTELCSTEIRDIIAEDTDLTSEESMLLAVGLAGLAQVAARFWLTSQGSIARNRAAELVATLGWRGIAGFPKSPRSK